jgi:hypothetical protein
VRWAVLAKRAGLEDKWLDDFLAGLDPLVVEAGTARAGAAVAEPAAAAPAKSGEGKAK